MNVSPHEAEPSGVYCITCLVLRREERDAVIAMLDRELGTGRRHDPLTRAGMASTRRALAWHPPLDEQEAPDAVL